MSVFFNFLRKGKSTASANTPGEKIAVLIGRFLACRHKNVTVCKGAIISPDAMINPRQGAIRIGSKSVIAPGVILQGNVKLGNNVSVQARTILIGYGTVEAMTGIITVGDNTRIAPNCMIIAANHRFSDPEKSIISQGMAPEPITIGSDVWIGGGVHINAGVSIGSGSVIGAGSVVTHDIPPMSIAAGVPARVIRKRA